MRTILQEITGYGTAEDVKKLEDQVYVTEREFKDDVEKAIYSESKTEKNNVKFKLVVSFAIGE
jgi:hypothetical protein